MRYDFDSEAEAFKFAADRRKESRDRILIIDPGGYIHDLKDGTPYV